jgi:hypothetical protein
VRPLWGCFRSSPFADLSLYGSQELRPLFEAVQRLDVKLREWAATTRI